MTSTVIVIIIITLITILITAVLRMNDDDKAVRLMNILSSIYYLNLSVVFIFCS